MNPTLSLYRQLYRAINKLPKKYLREEGLQELREAYLKPSSANVDELLLNGRKRLAFLHMQTGGKKVSSSSPSSTTYLARYSSGGPSGAAPLKHELVVDGEAVQQPPHQQHLASAFGGGGEKKARYCNWGPGNLDPDSVRRHENTLRRAGFKNNEHAKGGRF